MTCIRKAIFSLLIVMLPTMTLAQAPVVPCISNPAGGCTAVTSTNPLPTLNITPENLASLPFTNGQPYTLFVDDFSAGTLNKSTKWNRPTTGGGGNAVAATNAVGQTTLSPGTAANGFSVLVSQRTIWDRNPGYNLYQGNINLPIPSVTHEYMLFGFLNFVYTAGLPAPTLAVPVQDAAAFELGVDGKLRAVTFASQGKVIVADLSVSQGAIAVPGPNAAAGGAASGTFTGGCNCTPQIQQPKNGAGLITDSFKYVILFRGDNILWYMENQTNGTLMLVAFTTRGAVGLDVNQTTMGYLAMNDAVGVGSAAVMQVNQITVGDTAKNPEPGFDRSAYPQQALTAVNDAVGVNAMGSSSCTFTTVSNTNVTLVFEATDPNGTNWTAVTAYPQGGGVGIQTVPSGTNGQWTIPCAGINQVRMRVSAIGATPTVLGTAEASVGTPAAFATNGDSSLLTFTAAAAGTVNSADQINNVGRGVQLGVNFTVNTTCSEVVTIQGKDVASGQYYTLLASAAITTAVFNNYLVYPAAASTANVSANLPLPRTWRVQAVLTGASCAATGTVGASVIQ